VRIRHARIADLARLVAIENAAFANDRMSARQWRHHLGSPRADVLVAERAGAIVGAAVVFFHARHDVARLYSIAVAREARGAGIGAGLLAAAERAARRLYERRGYRVIGAKAGYYEDGADAVRYEKAL
jgi:ribosomal protein S18 acetylase RimI-like enzyme